jgi:hypothetical protein
VEDGSHQVEVPRIDAVGVDLGQVADQLPIVQPTQLGSEVVAPFGVEARVVGRGGKIGERITSRNPLSRSAAVVRYWASSNSYAL